MAIRGQLLWLQKDFWKSTEKWHLAYFLCDLSKYFPESFSCQLLVILKVSFVNCAHSKCQKHDQWMLQQASMRFRSQSHPWFVTSDVKTSAWGQYKPSTRGFIIGFSQTSGWRHCGHVHLLIRLWFQRLTADSQPCRK